MPHSIGKKLANPITLVLIYFYQNLSNGQFISKCLSGVFKSPKKPTIF